MIKLGNGLRSSFTEEQGKYEIYEGLTEAVVQVF